MKTTRDFLAELRAKHGGLSDYKLAPILGVHEQTINNYRKGRTQFDDVIALRVADLLGIEGGYVLACIAAERAKTDEVKKAWEHMAGLAAVLVLGLAILPQLGAHSPADLALFAGTTTGHAAQTLYIMLNAGPATLAALAAVFVILKIITNTRRP